MFPVNRLIYLFGIIFFVLSFCKQAVELIYYVEESLTLFEKEQNPALCMFMGTLNNTQVAVSGLENKFIFQIEQ